MRWRRGVNAWLLVAACLALVGCAVVDQYSGRAIVYNLEAEQAQDQALLLNIVRAYLRRPMQFTTVSSITGVASVSGGTQYTLPTNVPFRPPVQGATGIAQFPPLPTFLFSGSMSGGPAFTVPVLDTQEFYDGILKAIPAQLWDLYIQANYPPDLLFNLFVQKVVMHRKNCSKMDHTTRCEFVFGNYVGDDTEIDLFQALGDYVLWLGMTTEPQKPRTVPFQRPHNINIRYVGAPGSNTNGVPTAEVVAPPGGSAASETATAPKNYKLCFASMVHQELVAKNSRCGFVSQPGNTDEESKIDSSGSAVLTVVASKELIGRLRGIAVENDSEAAQRLVGFSGELVTLTIYMRNTEGMIYYLGELARRSLATDYGVPRRDFFARRNAAYKIDKQYSDIARCEKATRDCAYIFRLHEGIGQPLGDAISVLYNGQWYSVSSAFDPDHPDRSTMTLEFLKQLIAVNSSAKSLPQSSVLSVVGGQ